MVRQKLSGLTGGGVSLVMVLKPSALVYFCLGKESKCREREIEERCPYPLWDPLRYSRC